MASSLHSDDTYISCTPDDDSDDDNNDDDNDD